MTAQGLYISPTEYVAFGEPRPQRLSDHIATRERSPDFHALGLYLPNPDPILKKQGRDIAIYSDLRGDAHVGGCIRRRKASVLAMDSRVQRGQASARMTKLCTSVLDALDLRRLIREILDAPLFGWQPLEILWSPSSAGGPIVPLDVLAKPVQWFHYDAQAQLRFKSREQPLHGEATAARKFLVPAQDASYANPYGFADLSMCFWPTVFKRGGLKFWVTFSEKYGTPWLVGKTPRGTPPKEQNALLDQLEAMVQDAVAVIPDDASVNIVEASGKTASAELYEHLLLFCRSEISIALLGQNQTTEATSNRASASAGLQVTTELRDADARLAEATLNQLMRWIVDLNAGEGEPAPKFKLYEQQAVDTAQAERDEKLSRAGVRFTPQYYKRMYELEDGDLDEIALPDTNAAQQAAFVAQQKALPTAQPAAFSEPAQAQPGTDALDAIIDAEMADWALLLDPLIAPLQAAIDAAVAGGESAEQLLQRLPPLLGQIDSSALQDALTRAAFSAHVGGLAGLPLEPEDRRTDAAAPTATATFAEAPTPTPAPSATPPPTPIIVNVHPVIQMPEHAAPAAPTVTVAAPQITVQVPEQPAPVVQVDVHVPEQPAPTVTVQPFPARSVQTVERDAQTQEINPTPQFNKPGVALGV